MTVSWGLILKMSTFRVKKNKNNPYVVMNKVFLNDKSLSFKAKGLLAYLLSKPDDWVVYEAELSKASKDGRDSVRAGLKELMGAGYLHRYRERDEKGQLRQMVCDVYEVPTKIPAGTDSAGNEADDLAEEAKLIYGIFSKSGAPGDLTPEILEEIKQGLEEDRKRKEKDRWKVYA
jgi:hypothetical protein